MIERAEYPHEVLRPAIEINATREGSQRTTTCEDPGEDLTVEHVETASDNQRRELEAVAERSGWKIVQVYRLPSRLRKHAFSRRKSGRHCIAAMGLGNDPLERRDGTYPRASRRCLFQ